MQSEKDVDKTWENEAQAPKPMVQISLKEYDKLKENSKYISEMIGEKVLERFLSIANNANLTTGKFDKPIKAGGAVVFNEGGIHKGNKTSVSPRYALRFFFKKDKDFN